MPSLEEQLAAQQMIIDELRAQVERLSRRESMHGTLTCPSCGCGRIFKITSINEYSGQGIAPLSLGTSRTWAMIDGDPLHAYVCTYCHLVEWHVSSLEHIVPDGGHVQLLERPPSASESASPYR
jgi:hypothetical protein